MHIRMQSSVVYAGRRNNQYLLVGFPMWELIFLSISLGRFFNVGIIMLNEYKVQAYWIISADIKYIRYALKYPDDLKNLRICSKSTYTFYGIDGTPLCRKRK